MEIKTTKRSHLMGRILAMVMAVCMMFGMAVTANAAANQAVTDARSGVLQIQVWYHDTDAGLQMGLHSGTGFLINENTIVTNAHVAVFDEEWYAYMANVVSTAFGIQRTGTEVKEKTEIRISILRDVYVKASVKKASVEMDYAILTLEEKIYNRTPLKLRDSVDLKQTEQVFALGFPGDQFLENDKQYTENDVTITGGQVNKVGSATFYYTDEYTGKIVNHPNVDCVESSAVISGGNSGGPLVDANGYVVGINAATSENRNYAISSNLLIETLKALGISYTAADTSAPVGPAPTVSQGSTDTPKPSVNDSQNVDTGRLSALISEAEDVDEEKYTEDSYDALKKALRDAKSALTATAQADVDAAAAALEAAIDGLKKVDGGDPAPSPSQGGLDPIVLIAIIGGVVVLLIIIILVVVLKKKKPAPAAVPAAPQAPAYTPAPQAPRYNAPTPPPAQPGYAPRPQAPQPPVRPMAPVSNETTVLNQNAGETTVLNQGAGETTVLSQAINGGTLVRLNNNERITIGTSDFSVGRERNSVNYCISGNSNISRVHARFVVRGGVTFIVDNKAANGTFVNGVKLQAGQEMQLNSGDSILLADEKFEFRK